MNIAVFASGVGSTFERLLDLQSTGDLQVKVKLLVTDNLNAGALAVAEKRGIKFVCLSPKDFNDFQAWDKALLVAVLKTDVQAILLTGFLRKIGPQLLKHFENRIVNSHPSLLPKYGGRGMYGRKVHEAVLRAGEKQTGVTIHLVNAQYDKGEILRQVPLDILPGEGAPDLEMRIKELEKTVLVEFLNSWPS